MNPKMLMTYLRKGYLRKDFVMNTDICQMAFEKSNVSRDELESLFDKDVSKSVKYDIIQRCHDVDLKHPPTSYWGISIPIKRIYIVNKT